MFENINCFLFTYYSYTSQTYAREAIISEFFFMY